MGKSTFDVNNKSLEHRVNGEIIIVDYNLEITNITLKLDIHLDVNSMAYGEIVINDVENEFFNRTPLVGGELVKISIFSHVSSIPVFFKFFNISKITVIDKDYAIGNSKNRYKLTLTSPSIIKNNLKKISKGYSEPKRTSEIVSDILASDLGWENEKFRMIHKSNTVVENFIIPYMYPFEMLEYLKKISTNQVEEEYYLLYEDNYGIVFAPIDFLMKKQPLLKLDRSLSNNIANGTVIYNIKKDTFKTGVDILGSIQNNALGSTYCFFDREKKEVVEIEYTLNKSFLDNITTLGKNSFYKESLTSNSGMSDYITFPSNSEHTNKFAYYNIRRNLFNKYNLKIDIIGSFDVNIGDTIYLEIPMDGDTVNGWLSGTWLITHSRLRFTTVDNDDKSVGAYTLKTQITVSKDTYG